MIHIHHRRNTPGNDGNDRYDDRHDHEIDILLFIIHILMPQVFRGDAGKLCCSRVTQGSARGAPFFFASRMGFGRWSVYITYVLYIMYEIWVYMYIHMYIYTAYRYTYNYIYIYMNEDMYSMDILCSKTMKMIGKHPAAGCQSCVLLKHDFVEGVSY